LNIERNKNKIKPSVGNALVREGEGGLGKIRLEGAREMVPGPVLVFPGTGIHENLASRQKKLGSPVMKFEKGA